MKKIIVLNRSIKDFLLKPGIRLLGLVLAFILLALGTGITIFLAIVASF